MMQGLCPAKLHSWLASKSKTLFLKLSFVKCSTMIFVWNGLNSIMNLSWDNSLIVTNKWACFFFDFDEDYFQVSFSHLLHPFALGRKPGSGQIWVAGFSSIMEWVFTLYDRYLLYSYLGLDQRHSDEIEAWGSETLFAAWIVIFHPDLAHECWV